MHRLQLQHPLKHTSPDNGVINDAIVHVIRTRKIPFVQSHASWPLLVTTGVIMSVGVWLPFSPLGPYLGFTALPPLYWPLLALILLGYVLLAQSVKFWLVRGGWM
jgi:Mg2+-importing ATPase